MLTEANKGYLIDHMEKNVEWRYPLEGSDAYNVDITPFFYRRGEPVNKKFPAVEMAFLPRSDAPVRSIGDVIKWTTGGLVYGYGELEPIIITVYTHQMTTGTTKNYHGKLIADEYIRRIERYVRRYWPKMLQSMEAYIYQPMSFLVEDIGQFVQGNEQQGFELTMHIISTNKWDYYTDEYTGAKGTVSEPPGLSFKDAELQTATYDEITAGLPYSVNISVSGEFCDKVI